MLKNVEEYKKYLDDCAEFLIDIGDEITEDNMSRTLQENAMTIFDDFDDEIIKLDENKYHSLSLIDVIDFSANSIDTLESEGFSFDFPHTIWGDDIYVSFKYSAEDLVSDFIEDNQPWDIDTNVFIDKLRADISNIVKSISNQLNDIHSWYAKCVDYIPEYIEKYINKTT